MQSIFKGLEKEVVATRKKLGGSDGEDKLLINLKNELLEEMVDYVNSYEWLHKKPLKQKVQFFIQSGYDYEALCRAFDISYDSARSSIKWASNQLKKKIGPSTLQLIKEDRLTDAATAFYMGIGKIKKEDYIMKDLLLELPNEKFSAALDLKDCKNELIILRNLSTEKFYKYLDVMNEKKMAYCLHLIEGTSKKADNYKAYMIKYLIGEISLEELFSIEEDIKNEKIYY